MLFSPVQDFFLPSLFALPPNFLFSLNFRASGMDTSWHSVGSTDPRTEAFSVRQSIVIASLLVTMAGLGFGGGKRVRDLSSSSKERDTVSGREIYVNTCIRCHGIDGKGALGINLVPKPVDLTSAEIQDHLDATLFLRIHEGKSNTAMGAWKHALSDDEIWDVLAYVRTLAGPQKSAP